MSVPFSIDDFGTDLPADGHRCEGCPTCEACRERLRWFHESADHLVNMHNADRFSGVYVILRRPGQGLALAEPHSCGCESCINTLSMIRRCPGIIVRPRPE